MPTPKTIDELAAAPYNPRTITEGAADGLREALKRFGDISGITYNVRTKRLVCGHQRVTQLREAGAQMVKGALQLANGERFPVRVVDWTEAEEKAANVTANNPHIAGEFNADLDGLLRELQASMGDAEFESINLDALLDGLDSAGGDAADVDEDEIPEPPGVPVSQPGDVWILGDHRLVCGDSAETAVVDLAAVGASAYLLATDPPYGIDLKGKRGNPKAKEWDGIANDDRQGESFRLWLAGVLKAWLAKTFDDACAYVWFASTRDAVFSTANALRDCGMHVQSEIVWAKNRITLGRSDYHWKHENICYAFRKGTKHRWFGGRDKTTVWEVKKVAHADYLHPMQKPVELYAIPIRHHTKRGEYVLDPFVGSGTQIIAAEQLERRCCAAEIDPKFCDVTIERWETLTGGKAKREHA